MAFVLVLVALDQPGTHRKRRVNSLQCLYPTLLVCAHQVHTFFVEVQRLGVAFANPSNLRIKDLWLRSLAQPLARYVSRGVPDEASDPPLPKKRPTLRAEMLSTMPRLMASSASSVVLQ